MAKRRRLGVPSAADLQELEAGFAAKPDDAKPDDAKPDGAKLGDTGSDPAKPGPAKAARAKPSARPPIAQIAGDAAAFAQPLAAEDRAKAARDAADAAAFRKAEEEGRLAVEIPVSVIVEEELTRDRAVLEREPMEELKRSIAANGLRIPIEVYRLEPPLEGREYGLLSGYRRLKAVREVEGQGATIRAVIRPPLELGAAFAAMVEENEIRADLSHYERGRIAVLANLQGAFPSVAAAVDALFPAGSKAKRSKIRSFAVIHEELGDLLLFAHELSERAGLRLSNALRAGYAEQLRQALVRYPAETGAGEWEALEPVIIESEADTRAGAGPGGARGGRPRAGGGAGRKRQVLGRVELANGMAISKEVDEAGYAIRFHGRNVDSELVETVMSSIRYLLEPK
ncbi:MAG: ParB N-terminal domain-containing protein [Pseudomonadota bacterium]